MTTPNPGDSMTVRIAPSRGIRSALPIITTVVVLLAISGCTGSSPTPTAGATPGTPHLAGVTAQGQPDGQTAVATDWNPSYAFTAGEVISTLDDLETWGHALFTGEGVLSPRMQQLRRDSILTSPPPNTATAGYGIGIGNRDGWWGHTGEIPGYNTTIFHNYESETTVIVIVNSDIPVGERGNPAPLAQQALIDALG
jgi:D-alanyl-D-alanine carboxypeptidase